MKKLRIPFLIILLIGLVLFGFKAFKPAEISKSPTENNICRLVIDPNRSYQTIDNFGASDAWSMQYIGLWPEVKQQQMATWLFSTENDEQGNPKGIGLSLWRFYIGAGSSEQGQNSHIDDPWRRAECFLLSDGSYDWTKQKGQRYFMQLAKRNGVDQFLGFILSAPVYWTQNGLATNFGRGGTFNIKEDKYDDFAIFIAEVIEGIESNEGIRFKYICPFNEPDGHWNWTNSGQEGSAATKYEIAKTIRLIGKEFEKRKLTTRILAPESFDYNCMYQTHQYTDADHGYHIQSYFSQDSTESYIGNVRNVPNLLTAHSYWTTTPISNLRRIRKEMGEVLKKYNVNFWQTEVCVMSNDNEIGGGGGKDLTMKTALYIARIIHYDLVYANASAWHWWRAVANTDYKDGLIYCQADTSNLDGTFTDSKLMWALGNYSRFIRPGAVRIGISAYNSQNKIIQEGDTDPYALMLSAYKNTDNSLTVVIINYDTEDKKIKLELKETQITDWQPFLTSDSPDFNLKKQPTIPYNSPVKIPARSIITLIGLK